MITLIASLILAQPDSKTIWLEHLHMCENPHNVVKVMDSNHRFSYGYVMFQMNTWLSYGKKFGATKQNIGSSTLQAKVARDMLDKGLKNQWYWCSKKVTHELGTYK